MSTKGPSRRAAFTLVEMLVVIVIIGILAGLLLPAINMVKKSALRAQIGMDLNNVSQGLEAYKNLHGDYPPDFSDMTVVRRHILKAWPKIENSELVGAMATFNTYGVDPAEALAFWLGGFSSDPKHPFTGQGGPFVVDPGDGTVYANPERLQGSMELDKGRLTWKAPVVLAAGPPEIIGQMSSDGDNDPFAIFLPPQRKVPYVYFDCRTYGGVTKPPANPTNGFYPPIPGSTVGYARPYLDSDHPLPVSSTRPYGFEWVNETTYQVISAGLDDNYGGNAFLTDPLLYPHFPGGQSYLSPGVGDDDNITNFSEGRTLEDMKP